MIPIMPMLDSLDENITDNNIKKYGKKATGVIFLIVTRAKIQKKKKNGKKNSFAKKLDLM